MRAEMGRQSEENSNVDCFESDDAIKGAFILLHTSLSS
jgi:hypothetical protein